MLTKFDREPTWFPVGPPPTRRRTADSGTRSDIHFRQPALPRGTRIEEVSCVFSTLRAGAKITKGWRKCPIKQAGSKQIVIICPEETRFLQDSFVCVLVSSFHENENSRYSVPSRWIFQLQSTLLWFYRVKTFHQLLLSFGFMA